MPLQLLAEEAGGHVVGVQTLSNAKQKKLLWLVNQSLTRAAWWKLTLSQMITNLGCSGPSYTTALCSASRNMIMCAVL
jgi:hypothetical protein